MSHAKMCVRTGRSERLKCRTHNNVNTVECINDVVRRTVMRPNCRLVNSDQITFMIISILFTENVDKL